MRTAMISSNAPSEDTMTCPICQAGSSNNFFTICGLPINVCVQWPSHTEAVNCPRGDINLAYCTSCGHVWNDAFDIDKLNYTQQYENSLFCSPIYRHYSSGIVDKLIDRYTIRNKKVIDIGCGKGDFLNMLCKVGSNNGIGFDTSFDGENNINESNYEVIKDFYSKKYAHITADLVCSRYVFEHIADPMPFLRSARQSLAQNDRAVMYFEVPNAELIFKRLSVWDIIYEHFSYFSRSSLSYAFTTAGFDIVDLYHGFDSQFLSIEAKPAAANMEKSRKFKEDLAAIENHVLNFPAAFKSRFSSFKRLIDSFILKDKKIVLWGAGAKGVNLLNMLKISHEIPYVVDINQKKHGKFVAGTGQKIVAPDFLRTYKPDIIHIANPVYTDEIKGIINSMDINPLYI